MRQSSERLPKDDLNCDQGLRKCVMRGVGRNEELLSA